MPSSSPQSRFTELLEAMMDRTLSNSEAEELEACLLSSSEWRSQYIEMVALDANLSWSNGAIASLSMAGIFSEDKNSPVGQLQLDKQQLNGVRKAVISLRSVALFFSGAVAASLIVFAFPQSKTIEGGPISVFRIENTVAAVNKFPATLTGLEGVRWTPNTLEPNYGELLQQNRLIQFEEGLVQFTFENGVKILLEGPAKFRLTGESRATLERGRLSVVVPQRSGGFHLDTPLVEIVDFGTEFGVVVSEMGDTEVHVFDGEVLAKPTGAKGCHQEAFMTLVSQHAIYTSVRSKKLKKIQYHENQFIRKISQPLPAKNLPELPVDESLTLWLAADMLVERDEADFVHCWRDVLSGDNSTDESAWQTKHDMKPRWVVDGLGGLPALLFDGDNDMLATTPLPTGNEQTVFIAFSMRGTGGNNSMRQLLSYNGPPATVPPPNRGVLQIDDRVRAGILEARVHTVIEGRPSPEGKIPHHEIALGRCPSRHGVSLNRPIVLAYTYSRSDNRSELYLNGESQTTSTAPVNIATESRKAIGHHPLHPGHLGFAGMIGELIIYNSALDQKDIEAINGYLIEKYNVTESVQPKGTEVI